ncbi:MAG: hypothetical protein ACPGZU_21225, partial [Ketobacter sp.]
GQRLTLQEHDGTVLLQLPLEHPVGIVHQREWWNSLFANPLGYLPSPGVVDSVEIALPATDILPFGPGWLRSWYFTFFAGLILFSLIFKWRWKLH